MSSSRKATTPTPAAMRKQTTPPDYKGLAVLLACALVVLAITYYNAVLPNNNNNNHHTLTFSEALNALDNNGNVVMAPTTGRSPLSAAFASSSSLFSLQPAMVHSNNNNNNIHLHDARRPRVRNEQAIAMRKRQIVSMSARLPMEEVRQQANMVVGGGGGGGASGSSISSGNGVVVNAKSQQAASKKEEEMSVRTRPQQPRHNSQSYYMPFTGGFWKDYPGAQEILQDYLSRAERVVVGDKKLTGTVEYTPDAELCNQLLGLVASFTFAVTTNKYFGMKDETFPDWYDYVFDSRIGTYDWVLRRVKHVRTPGLRVIKHNTEHAKDNFPLSQLICSDLNREFPPEPTVNFNVNQYFVPLLQQNINHKSMFDKIGDDTFRPLVRFILRPHKDLAALVDTFVETNFKDKYVIGIHIRAGGNWPSKSDMWSQYWEAARALEMKLMGDDKNKECVWFLAADMDAPREEARKLFGNKVVMLASVFDTKDKGMRYRIAFADVLILAECDDLVTTSWSTFSYVAAGLAGIKPLMITQERKPQEVDTKKGGKTINYAGLDLWSSQRNAHVRQKTSQPCFHFYFDWRVQDAVCFREDMIEHEYMGGERYC